MTTESATAITELQEKLGHKTWREVLGCNPNATANPWELSQIRQRVTANHPANVPSDVIELALFCASCEYEGGVDLSNPEDVKRRQSAMRPEGDVL